MDRRPLPIIKTILDVSADKYSVMGLPDMKTKSNLSSVLNLVFQDQNFDNLKIGHLKSILKKCIDMKQYELLRIDREDTDPDVLILWTWLSFEAERKYIRDGISSLAAEDIGTTGNLWLIAIFGASPPNTLTAALAWANSNFSAKTPLGGEVFRCLAPYGKNPNPTAVAFIKESTSKGTIQPVSA